MYNFVVCKAAFVNEKHTEPWYNSRLHWIAFDYHKKLKINHLYSSGKCILILHSYGSFFFFFFVRAPGKLRCGNQICTVVPVMPIM